VVYGSLDKFYEVAAKAPRLPIPLDSPDYIAMDGFQRHKSLQTNGGLGVFTMVDRQAHEILMEYPGTLSTEDDNSPFTIQLGTNKYLTVGSQGKYMAHYINSGLNSNCVYVKIIFGSAVQILVVSLIPLKAGEELYIDYYDDTKAIEKEKRISYLFPYIFEAKYAKSVKLLAHGRKKNKRMVGGRWVYWPERGDTVLAFETWNLACYSIEYFLKKEKNDLVSMFFVLDKKDRKVTSVDKKPGKGPLIQNFELFQKRPDFRQRDTGFILSNELWKTLPMKDRCNYLNHVVCNCASEARSLFLAKTKPELNVSVKVKKSTTMETVAQSLIDLTGEPSSPETELEDDEEVTKEREKIRIGAMKAPRHMRLTKRQLAEEYLHPGTYDPEQERTPVELDPQGDPITQGIDLKKMGMTIEEISEFRDYLHSGQKAQPETKGDDTQPTTPILNPEEEKDPRKEMIEKIIKNVDDEDAMSSSAYNSLPTFQDVVIEDIKYRCMVDKHKKEYKKRKLAILMDTYEEAAKQIVINKEAGTSEKLLGISNLFTSLRSHVFK